MRHLNLSFEEQMIPLDLPDSAQRIQAANPAGRVPALRHGELLIWDSIAICEYLCELAGAGLPLDRARRAIARSVSAEMHSGFQALRTQWPMNARALGRRTAMTPALVRDIERIDAIWTECRRGNTERGPWLFGEYSLADAMYAPVVLRFRTYGAAVSVVAQHYMATVLDDIALKNWLAAAASEPMVISAAEVGA
jgi:glutathione S-transferase